MQHRDGLVRPAHGVVQHHLDAVHLHFRPAGRVGDNAIDLGQLVLRRIQNRVGFGGDIDDFLLALLNRRTGRLDQRFDVRDQGNYFRLHRFRRFVHTEEKSRLHTKRHRGDKRERGDDGQQCRVVPHIVVENYTPGAGDGFSPPVPCLMASRYACLPASIAEASWSRWLDTAPLPRSIASLAASRSCSPVRRKYSFPSSALDIKRSRVSAPLFGANNRPTATPSPTPRKKSPKLLSSSIGSALSDSKIYSYIR